MPENIVFCSGGGCGAKLGAGVLSKILGLLPRQEDKNLLTGFDGHEDAAVYRISDDAAIISTLDFFPPMVNDPYTFGQIAAANALSDIYAMGGRPLTALNIVCFPESMDMNILGKIMQGGNDKVTEAGALLVGGHSISDESIKYGLSVTGIISPDKVLKNSSCINGDRLILTKPLGTGIINAALTAQEASDDDFSAAVASMITLNKYAAEIIERYDCVHACTDVTGFGLIGHLSEMLSTDHGAIIEFKSVPVLPGAYNYAREFLITGAGQKNRNYAGHRTDFIIDDYAAEEILFDPQTSGGLLISVSPDKAEDIESEFRNSGISTSIIGTVTDGDRIVIK